MPVSVAVRLGSASITFEQLMNLSANDVLVLDTQVSDPVDLIARSWWIDRISMAEKPF